VVVADGAQVWFQGQQDSGRPSFSTIRASRPASQAMPSKPLLAAVLPANSGVSLS
jgi:hypothetical protein